MIYHILEVIAKLLCLRKSMILAPILKASWLAWDVQTKPCPGGQARRHSENWRQKGDFMRRTSFAIASLLLIFILIGCSSPSKEMVVLNRVIENVSQAVAEEENLYVWGIGYLGPELFKGLHLQYNSREWVNLEESRRIFIQTLDTIIRVVNQDEEFVKLRSAPLTSANLLLSIEFAHDDTDRYIGMIILANDKLFYTLRDPVTFKSRDIHKETIEDARQILQAENKSNQEIFN
jgi:hypothetical protein